MRVLLSVLFFGLSTVAGADDIAPPLPALYGVVDVASDDALNVRAAPDASARIVGILAADADNIEVVDLSLQGKWARINAGESTGWVSMRYLRAQPIPTTVLGLPVGLRCFGTEPFWDITFFDEMNLILNTPEAETGHAITASSPRPEFVNLSKTGFRFAWRQNRDIVTARIMSGQCSDGMSDRQFGLHYIDDQGLRSGCCSLN
jgi:uncharacterized membrane protein